MKVFLGIKPETISDGNKALIGEWFLGPQPSH